MNGPMCCGLPSYENVISPRLRFFVCKECKQEVKEARAELKKLMDGDEIFDLYAGIITTSHLKPRLQDEDDFYGV